MTRQIRLERSRKKNQYDNGQVDDEIGIHLDGAMERLLHYATKE